MRGSASRITLLSFVVSLTLTAGSFGQGSGAVTELDPGVTVMIDLPRRVRLDLYAGRETAEELSSSKKKIGGGISLRMKPVFKRFLDAVDTDKQHLLVLAMIYEYARASDQGETKIEHKLMADAIVRYNFPRDFLLSNRNRFENRWNSGTYHWRYRNRPMLERPFKVRKRDITPYIAAEAVWSQQYKKWHLFKFSGGVQVPLYRRTSLDMYYERQHCVTCSDPNTNIFGLNLNIHLRYNK